MLFRERLRVITSVLRSTLLCQCTYEMLLFLNTCVLGGLLVAVGSLLDHIVALWISCNHRSHDIRIWNIYISWNCIVSLSIFWFSPFPVVGCWRRSRNHWHQDSHAYRVPWVPFCLNFTIDNRRAWILTDILDAAYHWIILLLHHEEIDNALWFTRKAGI